VFTRKEIHHFAKREVCGTLVKASTFMHSGTEGMFLADRIEPWYELARPIQHNRMNVVYYWPEMEI
jgi:hypothetical protein